MCLPDAESGRLLFGGRVCDQGARKRRLMVFLKGSIHQIVSLSVQPLCLICPAQALVLTSTRKCVYHHR